MSCRKRLICGVFVLLISQSVSQTLRMVRIVPLPPEVTGKTSISSSEELYCDDAGNILLPLEADMEERAHPLVRISQNGSILTRIDIRSAPEFKDAASDRFALRGDGYTYVMSLKVEKESITRDKTGRATGAYRVFEDQAYVLVFNKTGQHDHTIRLPLDLDIKSFGVFLDGRILAVGWMGKANVPTSVILSPSGQIERHITWPDDLSRKEVVGEHLAGGLDGLRISMASDGNAYVLTRRYFPRITVITPTGDIVSSKELQLPDGIGELWKEQIEPGRVVAQLMPSEETKLSPPAFGLFDTATGRLLERYAPMSEEDWGLHLACVKSGVLTFTDGESLRMLSPSR
jgi:hypothetical protein